VGRNIKSLVCDLFFFRIDLPGAFSLRLSYRLLMKLPLFPLGFEYWSDPNDRSAGSITWQVDGQRSHRVLASAVAPDQGDGGSGVGQRLIPEEPMSIVMNLGMSRTSIFFAPFSGTYPFAWD